MVMHVDINSCFATIEQQANPLWRGKPLVVAAYTTDAGCILAASREAKLLGIKTGMRVSQGKMLCPKLIVCMPDPAKYRVVNRRLLALLSEYSPYVSVESVDEMVLDLEPVLSLRGTRQPAGDEAISMMVHSARKIKQRIKEEIGEWITVSIGIAPNRYLAKIASGLHKPDGLDVLTRENIEDTLSHLTLEDLCGIKTGNANRLRRVGITTPLAMYRSDAKALTQAFHSIMGHHWWMRLHGYEDGSMYKAFEDEASSVGPRQKTFGQSYALGKACTVREVFLSQILSQLVMKMGKRLRDSGYSARGVGVSLLFRDYDHWGARIIAEYPLFADNDFYHHAHALLTKAPEKPVRILAVWCYNLAHNLYQQQTLLEEYGKKQALTQAIDTIQNRFGDFSITPARMLAMEKKVLDRIAFGKVRGSLNSAELTMA